jgi:hypothetical protein
MMYDMQLVASCAGLVVPASLAGAMSLVQHANALTGRAGDLVARRHCPGFRLRSSHPKVDHAPCIYGKRGATDDDYEWIVFNKHKTAGWR